MTQHQTHTTTQLDRYPDIFQYCQEHYQPESILSFGCSTGEECFTLKDYFPNATIYGVENNAEALHTAKLACPYTDVLFSDNIRWSEVDMIFCLSVLCRHPETSELETNHLYSFQDFRQQCVELDQALNPGGVLVIYNANYCLMDTLLAPNYFPVRASLREEFVRKFDRHGQHINIQCPLIYEKAIWEEK